MLATSFALSGSIGTGALVLATAGVAVRLAEKLRSPTALTSTNNTKTTKVNNLFIESPTILRYTAVGFYVVQCCQGGNV